MESLIATDWLKEYDPLFDLFDEEMRANQTAGCYATSNNLNDYECYDLNYNCNALGGYIGGFIGGGTCGMGNIQDKLLQQQTDELALVLGLEWLPCPELNSPTSNGSSNVVTPSSSSAPSPTLASSSSVSLGKRDLLAGSGYASTNLSTSISNKISKQNINNQISCFSSSALTPHTTSNHCRSSSSTSSSRTLNKKVSTPSTNTSSSSSVKALKRKCLKQKVGGGTSLLLHPSPVKSIHTLHTSNQHNSIIMSSNNCSSSVCSNIPKPALPVAQRYCIMVEHAYAATLS